MTKRPKYAKKTIKNKDKKRKQGKNVFILCRQDVTSHFQSIDVTDQKEDGSHLSKFSEISSGIKWLIQGLNV